MKITAFCIVLLAAAPALAQSAGPVALAPYVGGRVLDHMENGSLAYTYSWPGVYFDARFQGPSVSVKVDDANDDLYLYVDGSHKLTLTRPGRTTVSLNDLGPGPHEVRLEKASETQASAGTFDGFFVADASDALPPPVYQRRIEFIGDSYTVGYGDQSRGQICTVDDVRDTTDTSPAFAPITAKHFDAAYRILASSGYGVVRNYGGKEPGNTLPVLYNYTLFDKSVSAADEGWTPDVVVIGLGTNDFSTPLNPGEAWATRDALHADFVRTYVAFVQLLRAKWPKAHIILMASTNYQHEIIDEVDDVAAALKSGGDKNLEVIAFSGLDYRACDGHPSLRDHVLLADMLIDRIAKLHKFRGFPPPPVPPPAPAPVTPSVAAAPVTPPASAAAAN